MQRESFSNFICICTWLTLQMEAAESILFYIFSFVFIPIVASPPPTIPKCLRQPALSVERFTSVDCFHVYSHGPVAFGPTTAQYIVTKKKLKGSCSLCGN